MTVPTADPMVSIAEDTFSLTFLALVLFKNFLALSNCESIDFFFVLRLLPFSSRLVILTSLLSITLSELLPFPL